MITINENEVVSVTNFYNEAIDILTNEKLDPNVCDFIDTIVLDANNKKVNIKNMMNFDPIISRGIEKSDFDTEQLVKLVSSPYTILFSDIYEKMFNEMHMNKFLYYNFYTKEITSKRLSGQTGLIANIEFVFSMNSLSNINKGINKHYVNYLFNNISEDQFRKELLKSIIRKTKSNFRKDNKINAEYSFYDYVIGKTLFFNGSVEDLIQNLLSYQNGLLFNSYEYTYPFLDKELFYDMAKDYVYDNTSRHSNINTVDYNTNIFKSKSEFIDFYKMLINTSNDPIDASSQKALKFILKSIPIEDSRDILKKIIKNIISNVDIKDKLSILSIYDIFENSDNQVFKENIYIKSLDFYEDVYFDLYTLSSEILKYIDESFTDIILHPFHLNTYCLPDPNELSFYKKTVALNQCSIKKNAKIIKNSKEDPEFILNGYLYLDTLDYLFKHNLIYTVFEVGNDQYEEIKKWFLLSEKYKDINIIVFKK